MGRRSGENPDQLGLFAHDEPTAVPEAPSEFLDGPLPDADARRRIRQELDTNLLVEAGAGSGKTRSLVDRMVALVVTDTASVDRIAAVTFTRKAAAELQQRFRTRIEGALAEARAGGRTEDVDRLDRALRDIHRAFIGTIHSFCARLLRERPVEAGLDPGFEELMGVEEERMRRGFWRAHLERLAGTDDPMVAELADVGLTPSRIEGLYEELVENPDVHFPTEPVAPPSEDEVAAVRRRLDALIDRGAAMLPDEPDPERGWDKLQQRIRLLRFQRRVVEWNTRPDFLEVLGEEVVGRSYSVVQKRWPDGGAAKKLCEDWGTLRDGAAPDLMDRWWAHRYPIAMRFARRAADAFEAERLRAGRLSFQDLLIRAAGLLREHPDAREELGRRYRHVLVDEFQDTDPVQAEVLMLLASPPGPEPWQRATPRPGALFVVGDPKQSIYRFRRADIAVYNLVRDRFREVGDVVELMANFRSLPPFEGLVEEVFRQGAVPSAAGEGGSAGDGRHGEVGEGFPPEATTYQAAFAPLRTRRVPDPDRSLIGHYYVSPDAGNKAAIAEDGAARLARWIAGEVDAGRRRPRDFLLLARTKAPLAAYARALEAWGVPVQVTGAGVVRGRELAELLVVLDVLSDPTDPVLVVAALRGLFFGLDLDTLLDWTLQDDGGRRRFDITDPPKPGPDSGAEHAAEPGEIRDEDPVGDALRTLNDWWRESRTTPADVLVARIVDRAGLVPLAASSELGELRAGSLLFALDTLRVAALNGDTSVPAATEALRTALDSDEAEAALEPVRKGAVRVMTLHQAKGLEAPVVALVHPARQYDHAVTSHIERGEDGSAVGYLVVEERRGSYDTRVVARPAGWEARAAEERRYDAAEQERLLYVAATRARDALIVARKEKEERSPWARLHPWLDEHGRPLDLDRAPVPEPEVMERDARELMDAAARLSARREAMAEPRYLVRTATGLARSAAEAEAPQTGSDVPAREDGRSTAMEPDPTEGPDPSFRGLSWGSAVHGALDAAARGAGGEELRVVCRSILLDAERPVRNGEPVELDELVSLVESVLGSELWQRAQAASRMLSEVPFALHAGPGELYDPDPDTPGDVPILLEGVIDLAFRDEAEDGWVVVDYKTDVGTDAGFTTRYRKYRRQVDLYAEVWEDITGQPVVEKGLYFTARPEGERLDRW